MKQKPLVSVGMPVYNGEKYIRQALDSLLSQDYENFELIISDNASTDNTSTICMEYARKDQRIRYYQNETNIGVTLNFLRALELAHGDYFMWAACDDLWMPGFISSAVLELEKNPDAAVAMSAVKRIYNDDQSTMDIVRHSGKEDPAQMSYFELGMALAAGKPYHLYIYGIYRADFITLAVRNFPRVAAGDRLFVCQAALATRFLYIDQILHVRRVSRLSIAERFKSDPLGQTWRDLFAGEKSVLAMGPYLWKSSLIPFHRKLYIPFMVFRFGFSAVSSRFRRLISGIRFHLKRLIHASL